ncbi:MAG: hypothetical protein ACOC8D_02140, partial [bacterium]
TLAAHWLFLGATIGGTLVVLLNALRGDRELNRGLTPFLPFFLSAAMTVGVAPLLFVQVLYGQFFYTANILLGFFWLGLLAIVIVTFYLFWWAWHRGRQGKAVWWLLPAAALVLFVKAATILSSNATLTQSPEAWEGLWARGMNALYMGAPTLVPRLLFALSGFLAGGGLVVAVLSQAGLLYGGAASARGKRRGLAVAVPALLAQVLLGVLLLIALPPAQRRAVLAGGAESAFAYVAALAFVATAVFAWRARATESLGRVICPAVLFFVGLLGVALARDTARCAALAPYYDLSAVPMPHPEWLNLGLFLVVFLAGLGVIAYLVKLARTESPAPEDGPERPGRPLPQS